MNAIDVIIADDHKLFREGLISLLKQMPEIGNIRQAENGQALINMLEDKEPLVVILDLELPEIDGFEAARIIINKHPNIKILIISMYGNPSFVKYLWELGVHGYVLKSADVKEMKTAILSVVEKDFFKNQLVSDVIDHPKPSKNVTAQVYKFTARELSVLKLLCSEKTSKEIGEELKISYRTVEKIRLRIMERLGVKNVVGVVKYAIRNKLLKI